MNYKIINPRKRTLVRAGDLILRGLSGLGILRSLPAVSQLDPSQIQRIIIIRLAYIGDVVMTQPVIPVLRGAFPDAQIDLLTSHAAGDLLISDPGINEVIRFNAPWFYPDNSRCSTKQLVKQLAGKGYDLGIDFRGDIRNIYHCLYQPGIPRRMSYDSGGGGRLLTHPVPWTSLKHKVEYHLDILKHYGFSSESLLPRLYLSDEETDAMRLRLKTVLNSDVKPVVIHPGARIENKLWPAAKYSELIRLMTDMGMGPIIMVAHESERNRTQEITDQVHVDLDLTGQLNIRELAALFSVSRFLVCHDSAAMHIAAAVNCPVVALFGPSRPIETAPCGQGHIVMEGQCERKNECDEVRCLVTDTAACIRHIETKQVLTSCENLFNSLN